MTMTDYNMRTFQTGFLTAEGLEENTIIEATVLEVTTQAFEEEGEVVTKPEVKFNACLPVVLNQTRLAAMIRAFGPHSANWIGKQVHISRGQTIYSGRQVACVVFDPVTAPRLEGGGAPAQAIEGPKAGPAGAAAEPTADVVVHPSADIGVERRKGKHTIMPPKKGGGSQVLDDLRNHQPPPDLDDDITFKNCN
jgi:hypothetical protein